MGQNICDRAPATPRTGAAENQCRQYSAVVVRCPGFIGNNFLQVLERHLNYLVSQYELIRTRTMAHFLQLTVDVPSEAPARSIPPPLLCTLVTSERLDGVPSTQRRLRRFLLNNQPGGPRRKSLVPLNLGLKQGAEE